MAKASSGEFGLPRVGMPNVGDRFELRARVGEGAFGVVYEVFDNQRAARLALKELRMMSPDALLAFKREFRQLTDLRHPNLVRLFELFEISGRWFFTMELVPGVELLRHVGERVDGKWRVRVEALRNALVQLSQGLKALHDHGMVHRDVKPSNVRVTPEGRVVLLDFGLVAALGCDEDSVSLLGGTAAYMAPEQIGHDRAGPAADLYAMGTLLYEALTGRLPFEGSGIEVMLQKAQGLVTPPREHDPHVPYDLEELCLELLSSDASRRPSLDQVIERVRGRPLSLAPAAFAIANDTRAKGFVGRELELQLLNRAAEHVRAERALAVVCVEGESGLGKSTLVRELTKYHLDRNTVTLWGRCHERETVPYNALDGAADSLAAQLARMSKEELDRILPVQASLLAQLFPVLGRVPAIAQGETPGVLPRDPTMLRNQLFEKWSELLHKLSQQRDVVLVLDDLQWADSESVALLDDLLRPPKPPALLVLITTRPGQGTPQPVREAIARFMSAASFSHSLELPQLSTSESELLVSALLPERDAASVGQIVREAHGHPLFLEALTRYLRHDARELGVDLEQLLTDHVNRLDSEARRVLELVCLAGVPLKHRVLSSAASLDGERLLELLPELSAERLVRVHQAYGRDAVEPYHDRIRVAITSGLPEATRVQLHRRLAIVLEADAEDDEAVARHWVSAGEAERATMAAIRAADTAMNALAFEKAAGLYEWALSLNPPASEVHRLRVQRAYAYDRSGRALRAAAAFRDALSGATGLEAIELRRQLAQHLIRAGQIEEGLESARELLAIFGERLPKSPSSAMALVAWEWLQRGFTSRKFVEREATPLEIARADTLYSISSSLGPVAVSHAAYLGARHVRAAFHAGEPGRAALAVMGDVFGLYFMGRHARIPGRLAEARALAARSTDPMTQGICLVMEGSLKATMLEYEQASALFTEAEAMLTTHSMGFGWLLQTALVVRLVCKFMSGNVSFVQRDYPSLERRAMLAEDPYARMQVLLYAGAYYQLSRGRPDLARRAIHDARDAVTRPALSVEDFMAAWQELLVDAYEGDASGAQRFLERWEEVKKAGLARLRYVAQFGHLLAGASHLQLMQREPAHADKHFRKAREARRMLESIDVPRAMLLESALCSAMGKTVEALAALERVDATTRGGDDVWTRRVLRRMRAELLGGERGMHLHAEVMNETRESGIAEPERFLAAWIPFWILPGRD